MRRSRASPVLAALVLLAGCVQNDGRRFDPIRELTEVTEDDERAIGVQFDREISRVVPIVDDPVVESLMNELGQDLVHRIEPQPFIYRFRVIVSPSLNAFAVPGGFVYLHSGTILAASSVDELAGVVAHEIGHVRGRHFARLQEKTAVPSLLATLAGIAAGVAAGRPEPMIAGQGINVAMQLQFTRELEAEADRVGLNLLARSGYDPRGLARFFEKIVALEGRSGIELPPYLFSHPDVKSRIAVVNDTAPALRVAGSRPADLDAALVTAQARLALLVRADRTSWLPRPPAYDRAKSDPLLAEAARRAAAKDLDGALRALDEAARAQPDDPRIPFRRGELLDAAGRKREAAEAFERALALDPTTALVAWRLGLAHRDLGDRQRAVFYFEQAMRRFGPGSAQQKKAAFEVEKLTFRPLEEAGLADGANDAPGADTVAGFAREAFDAHDATAVWWGKLGARWLDAEKLEKMRVRWRDPSGALHAETPLVRVKRPWVVSTLPLAGLSREKPGRWTLELDYDGDVLDRRSFLLSE